MGGLYFTNKLYKEREKELEKQKKIDRRKRKEELTFKMKKIKNILLRESETIERMKKKREDLQIFSRVTLFSYPHVKKRTEFEQLLNKSQISW